MKPLLIGPRGMPETLSEHHPLYALTGEACAARNSGVEQAALLCIHNCIFSFLSFWNARPLFHHLREKALQLFHCSTHSVHGVRVVFCLVCGISCKRRRVYTCRCNWSHLSRDFPLAFSSKHLPHPAEEATDRLGNVAWPHHKHT